ncbi:hypothetical protein [Rheinheimera maricola]|uniref:Zinc ribbon domain-containing protein n=1 Tax=Rheinheimera maricola TaxID=2793282 RepID=A0ABS7X5I1_9GAMM|nr:hypothetical protein [Rheinheimera maricola]MBZ9610789.1 hypothetical protein [Rheinheimera maricola]
MSETTQYTQCKQCRGKIELTATRCPYCRVIEPVAKKIKTNDVVSNVPWGLFINIGVVAIVLFGLYSCMKESPEEKQQKSVAAAKNKRAGFHCLSGWDGSHSNVVRQVKSLLRDPNSFEHVSTKLTPVDETGRHTLFMRYNAKNGFGGVTPGFATAIVVNANCEATLATNE